MFYSAGISYVGGQVAGHVWGGREGLALASKEALSGKVRRKFLVDPRGVMRALQVSPRAAARLVESRTVPPEFRAAKCNLLAAVFKARLLFGPGASGQGKLRAERNAEAWILPWKHLWRAWTYIWNHKRRDGQPCETHPPTFQ